MAEGKLYLGIDIGSLSTNAVLINERGGIVDYEIILTGSSNQKAVENIMAKILEKSGLRREDMSSIGATGYGRVQVPGADKIVTEIACHAKGTHHLFPEVRTIIDIGGQDSKAIKVDKNGKHTDFVMNDKCAAGTGRFLENMARALEIELEDMGPLSIKSSKEIKISSMCTVFAESEVVSLRSADNEIEDVCRGLHLAIAKRIVGQAKRVGVEEQIVMTGGVAKNIGVVKELEGMIGCNIAIPQEPQIVGALGAALFALESENGGERPADIQINEETRTGAEMMTTTTTATLCETEMPKIGYTCSYVPVEVIRAAGFHPFRIFSKCTFDSCSEKGCSDSCSYIKSILAQKNAGELNDFAAIVFANSCDGMKSLYTLMNDTDGNKTSYFFIDVPRNNDENSVKYFANQIQKLKEKLEKLAEKTITSKEMEGAIGLYNDLRTTVSGIIKQGHTLVNYASLKKGVNAVPEKFIEFAKTNSAGIAETVDGNQLKLYLWGGLLEDDKIFQIIKENGARVFADDLCNYSRYFASLIERNKFPVTAIAKHYLSRIPCPRMQNSQTKIEEIVSTIKKYFLDGGLYYSLKFCDQTNSDLVIASKLFKKSRIPLLSLICDSNGNYGQIRTRIEAFIESIRRR